MVRQLALCYVDPRWIFRLHLQPPPTPFLLQYFPYSPSAGFESFIGC